MKGHKEREFPRISLGNSRTQHRKRDDSPEDVAPECRHGCRRRPRLNEKSQLHPLLT